ncbi:MAG TPA: sugar phosphate isomerase/epimerase family protein [Fimbriimonadales bacterium]|jgi:hexulose-6-phosphate isomerase|nr:sugar phosphate isomerase/epimerase family protein [Fimbriimonadales bacterium]
MILKSINYWSMPGGLDGSLSLQEFFGLAAKYKFPAVEVAVGETGGLNLSTSEEECQKILATAETEGVKIASVASGLYWSRSVGDAEASSRSAAQGDLRKMLQITAWLGCRTLLVIPGSVDVFFNPDRAPIDYKVVWDRASEGIRSCLDDAQRLDVRMGIENVWNKFLLSPMEMASFIDQFGSAHVGAYVDVGNCLLYGYPQQWLRILAERVVGIHFKDFRKAVGTVEGFVDLLEGDVDWPEVKDAIKEIGYEGPIAAEMIPQYKHHPLVRVANTSAAMDAILEAKD